MPLDVVVGTGTLLVCRCGGSCHPVSFRRPDTARPVSGTGTWGNVSGSGAVGTDDRSDHCRHRGRVGRVGAVPASGRITSMYISAKVDYAVRALCTLAAADTPLTSEALATSQGLPAKFLESILNDMRRAGLLTSQRGPDGGYRLARPAEEITVADVIRPLDGPLAEIRGLRPEAANYEGAAEHLQAVWVAVRASLRSVLDRTEAGAHGHPDGLEVLGGTLVVGGLGPEPTDLG